VRASLPMIAPNVIPDNAASAKINAGGSESTGKFSSVLAEATQKANPQASAESATTPEVAERKYSTAEKGESEQEIPRPVNSKVTTKSTPEKKLDEPERSLLSPEALPVYIATPPTANITTAAPHAESASGPIVADKNSDFSLKASAFFQSAQLPPAQTTTTNVQMTPISLPLFASTTTLPISDESATAAAAADSKPQISSTTSNGTTVPAPALSKGTDKSEAAPMSNNPPAAFGTIGQSDEKSLPQPIAPSVPVVSAAVPPPETQDQPGKNSVPSLPLAVGQHEPMPSTATMAKNVTAALSPVAVPFAKPDTPKATSEESVSVPEVPAHGSLQVPDPKPESRVPSAPPHLLERSQNTAPETVSHAPVATASNPVSTMAAPLPVPFASQDDATFEITKPSSSGDKPASSSADETAAPATSAKVTDQANTGQASSVQASTGKSAPESQTSTPSASSSIVQAAPADSDSASSSGKVPAPAALNVTQTGSNAIENSIGRTAAKSDPHSTESAVQSGEAEIAAGKQAASVAAYSTPLFQSARLVERLGQTELRVGVQAGEFGNVDIRTSMVRNQFSAEISVERGELGRVLAAELPALQNRLSEQRVATANITLQSQSGNGGSAGFEQGSRQSQTMQQTAIFQTAEEDPVPAAVAAAEISAPGTRLDIHM
jgi:flagellar hook-length control protein FliK